MYFMSKAYIAFLQNKINEFINNPQGKKITKYLPINQDPVTFGYVYPIDKAKRNISQSSVEDTIVFHKFLEKQGRSRFILGPNFDKIVKFGNVCVIPSVAHKYVKDYIDYKILLWLSTTFRHIQVPTNPLLRLIFGDSYILLAYNINKDDPEVQIPRDLPLHKDLINKNHQEVQIPRPRDPR